MFGTDVAEVVLTQKCVITLNTLPFICHYNIVKVRARNLKTFMENGKLGNSNFSPVAYLVFEMFPKCQI